MSPDNVEAAMRQTIADFGSVPDLFQIHKPWAVGYKGQGLQNHVDPTEVWRRMIEGHRKGLARYIGVSNFNVSMIQRLIDETDMIPATIEIESHPYLPTNDMVEFSQKYNITLLAYAPVGCPIMAKANKNPVLLEDPEVKKIADKHGLTPAQVALKWQLQRAPNVIPLPHTTSIKHLEENIGKWDTLKFLYS